MEILKSKIVIVGASHTGKTAIITKYMFGEFNPSLRPTTQGSGYRKTVHCSGRQHDLEIWDTAGQEQYRALGPMYYRNAQAGIVVYDTTDKRSFDQCAQWIAELRQAISGSFALVLVGNKTDLQSLRKVSRSELCYLAGELQVEPLETSAKTGENIDMLFTLVVRLIEQTRSLREETPLPVRIVKRTTCSVNFDSLPSETKTGCCP
jgi:small GTP-binding protein